MAGFHVKERARLVYEFDIEGGRPWYNIDNSASIRKGSFHRVGYYLQLQHPERGNQWIYTCFDAHCKDARLIGIPERTAKVFNCKVANMSVYDSTGVALENLEGGKIHMCPYNYFPSGEEDGSVGHSGDYGCMQVFLGDDVLWAYNCHNGLRSDIGIGNYSGNVHADWTFASNSDEYTFRRMRIYAIVNEISLDEEDAGGRLAVDTTGATHGDSLRFDCLSNTWRVSQVHINNHSNTALPNFVIAVTGQGCAQGFNSSFDFNNRFDRPHERIFGYDEEQNAWGCADLNAETVGSFCYREPGWQCPGFHFARRLVENNRDARPGIIKLGACGRRLCHWARYERSETWYSYNKKRALLDGAAQQGEVFMKHSQMIERGMSWLKDHGKLHVDVLLWILGDSDDDMESPGYYEDAICKVARQYRSLLTFGPNTKIVICEVSHTGLIAQTRAMPVLDVSILADVTDDVKYISSEGHRHLGTLCFNAYRSSSA